MISWPNSRECSASIPDITLHMLHASPHIGLTCSYGFQSYTFHCQAEKSFSRIEDSEYSTGEISSGCVDMRWTILGSHVHARSWHLSHTTYCRWCDLWQMKYCDVWASDGQAPADWYCTGGYIHWASELGPQLLFFLWWSFLCHAFCSH